MSQEQPMRDQGQEDGAKATQGIRYGDVFNVTGELAGQPIAPQDAATMQTAEYAVLGAPQPGGPAALMASAATWNLYAGVVEGNQASDVARQQGIKITETPIPGGNIVTEFVAGQAVGQYAVADAQIGGGVEDQGGSNASGGGGDGDDKGGDQQNGDNTKLTIGDALEATARAIGDEPVLASDAVAIGAAETTASRADVTIPGGIGDAAVAAASNNIWVPNDEVKIKLGDVLSNATVDMLTDKPVEPEDAEKVVDAEVGSKPDHRTRPAGVAVALAAAARINQDDMPQG
ncbi:Late embryogenesis abundant protein D-34 [Carex littledalei]|uniref:Late embryogenesis abundant protein D-34 n=1 Tax=Carex littledalei TaxID=544730 RepID=A0A833QME4_9POAL|nr:Late embryogenesis abundant protein D-34 [Carex littledalei]